MQKENKSKGVRKANSSSPMAEAVQMVEEEIEMPECAHEHLQIAPQCAAQLPCSCHPSYLNAPPYFAL